MLSRREFARRAAATAAAFTAMPGTMLDAQAAPAALPPQEAGSGKAELSAEALAEVEAKVAGIFRRHGATLSEVQKTEVRRLVREMQAPLEALRAFPLQNSDEPATVLRTARRPAPAHRPPGRSAAPAKKGSS